MSTKMVTLTSMPRSTSAIDTRPKMYLVEVPRRVAFIDVGRDGRARAGGSSGHVNMTDDGEDNPFRPGSELSREADIIVNLIKEGKPITPTRDMVDAAEHSSNGLSATATKSADLHSSPNRGGHNSSSSPAKTPMAPGVVEVQHGIIVPPGDKTGGGGGVQVEQVTLKKKRKCCTIQ